MPCRHPVQPNVPKILVDVLAVVPCMGTRRLLSRLTMNLLLLKD